MLGVRKWPLLWVVAVSEIDFTLQINIIADLTFMQFEDWGSRAINICFSLPIFY